MQSNQIPILNQCLSNIRLQFPFGVTTLLSLGRKMYIESMWNELLPWKAQMISFQLNVDESIEDVKPEEINSHIKDPSRFIH